MIAATDVASALFAVCTRALLPAGELFGRTQAQEWEAVLQPRVARYSIAVLAALLVATEAGLIAIPHLRRTSRGRWAEHRLSQTRFYAIAKKLYWQGTPGFLRRWGGRSRVSTMGDMLKYSRYHRQRLRDIADVQAHAHLLTQDPAGFEFWSTQAGSWWIQAGQSSALFELIAEQKRGIYKDPASMIRAGDVVLDCGANVGCFTRQALMAGARRVVAIEPSPGNLECLKRNLAAGIADGSVKVCPKGLWFAADCLVLSGSGVSARFLEETSCGGESALRVPLTTIDMLAEECGLNRVDFIKMDIEGAEVAALMGAKVTLAKHRPRLALAGYHNQEDSEAIPAAVRAAWPECCVQYGRCYHPGLVRPETLFFHG